MIMCCRFKFLKLSEAKRKSDEDQALLEELQSSKKKAEKENEGQRERIEELQTENSKLLRSKKKVQEEVRERERTDHHKIIFF